MREVSNAEWDDIRDRLKENDAEIEKLKDTNMDLQRECVTCSQRITYLESLIARAAHALDRNTYREGDCKHCQDLESLIQELRKAQE